MDNQDCLLRVESLTVHFHTDRGVVKALDRAELRVGKGEVVGLIGESGSGKSTMARAVLGVLPATGRVVAGSIRFAGRDLRAMKESELNQTIRGKRIALIPQDPFNSLNPVFTVGTQIRDIVKWKLGNLKGAEADARILQMLERVRIPAPRGQSGKYPHQLSGGQRQRIMIAMALLPGPDLVIADEPTTALDVTVEAQILRLLHQLVVERGVSVLFITHDLGVASNICGRIVVMYAGQDMEDAPAETLLSDPRHPYTRELLGSLPRPDGNIRDIPGEMPSMVDPPEGCRFHPRCPRTVDRCREALPGRTAVSENHWVRCFRPLE